MAQSPPSIVTIVHVYYPEFCPELAGCLRNIKEPFDLFVSVRSYPNGDAVCGKVMEDFPFARISRSENVGYDIWPFLFAINAIDLSLYDIVVQLLTKRDLSVEVSINGFDMSGSRWRQNLVRFISTDKAWKATNKLFAYPTPPHKQGAYAEWAKRTYPVTEKIHREVLGLPISPTMMDEEVQHVVDVVNDF